MEYGSWNEERGMRKTGGGQEEEKEEDEKGEEEEEEEMQRHSPPAPAGTASRRVQHKPPIMLYPGRALL